MKKYFILIFLKTSMYRFFSHLINSDFQLVRYLLRLFIELRQIFIEHICCRCVNFNLETGSDTFIGIYFSPHFFLSSLFYEVNDLWRHEHPESSVCIQNMLYVGTKNLSWLYCGCVLQFCCIIPKSRITKLYGRRLDWESSTIWVVVEY